MAPKSFKIPPPSTAWFPVSVTLLRFNVLPAFEEPLVGQPLDVRRVDIKNECRGCHAPDRFPGLRSHASGPLTAARTADALERAVKWKREGPDWKALRKLLAE
jgi:hypothetical protein